MSYDIEKDVDYAEYENLIRTHCADNIPLAKRIIKLYRELSFQGKKEVFDILVLHMLHEIHSISPISPLLTDEEAIVNELENFKKLGLLEQVMGVVSFFIMRQKEMHEEAKKYSRQKASNQKTNTRVTYCKALENFLIEVESIWHPLQKDGEPARMVRNSQMNKKSALKKVYDKHSAEIEEKLRSCGFQGDCKKQFYNCFDYYTNKYVEVFNDGKTINGHVRETRAHRSEASRKKSSRAAKEVWAKRKMKQ